LGNSLIWVSTKYSNLPIKQRSTSQRRYKR